MTATGSHVYFYSLRGAPPSRGRLSLRRVLRIEFERIGACRRPYKSNQPRTSEGRLLLEEKLSARKG